MRLKNFDFKFHILPMTGGVQYLRIWQLRHLHPASDCTQLLLLSVPHYWSFPKLLAHLWVREWSLFPLFWVGRQGLHIEPFKKIHWQLEETARRNTCKRHFAQVLHLRNDGWCPFEGKADHALCWRHLWIILLPTSNKHLWNILEIHTTFDAWKLANFECVVLEGPKAKQPLW